MISIEEAKDYLDKNKSKSFSNMPVYALDENQVIEMNSRGYCTKELSTNFYLIQNCINK